MTEEETKTEWRPMASDSWGPDSVSALSRRVLELEGYIAQLQRAVIKLNEELLRRKA